MEGWQGRLWKNPGERLFLKNLWCWRQLGGPITRLTTQTSNRRGHTTSPSCSHKWPPPLTCWALRSMRCRRPGSSGKTSRPPTGWPRPPQKISTSLELSCTQSHQNHGPQGHPFTWSPIMMGWPDFLSLVWEGGPEWGDSGKPHVDYALPPQPHLCPQPGLLYHQHRGHALTHPSL